ncbi:MAG TPA: FliM/FliN family flagellar motor switch protein [Bacillota bacterium]|nr:FliM/FliN family flagellar motor switch protein [Bacillota bacterium]HOP68877.1 FliM/FliN family flagellar motor switch protein [Bacillota bacterium]HPT33384.1 FliM/FliN family flagellar motor switch protein [Bacillota bacterium]HPZ64161.1 FliM/FliN family flagellar motor switch protein [Bacillota bacterium]HQD05334.1 FliM/FliN family flagellar motor switch protein [Bacillota bacterium]
MSGGEGKKEQQFNIRRAGPEKGRPGGAQAKGPTVEKVEFCPLTPPAGGGERLTSIRSFEKVPVTLSAELGKTQLKVRDLIKLEQGSLIKLDKLADESVVLLANEVPLAYGEVVVINDRFGVRITAFISDSEQKD